MLSLVPRPSHFSLLTFVCVTLKSWEDWGTKLICASCFLGEMAPTCSVQHLTVIVLFGSTPIHNSMA